MKIYFLFILFSILNLNSIIHSNMTNQEIFNGSKAPKEVIDSMVVLDVEYYNFAGKLCKGQLVVNKAVQQDVSDAFQLIKEIKYPIEKVIPISNYDWDDDRSMEDNNTSAFNYRFVANTNRLSNHSFGRAVDFNPVQNPAVYKDGTISPKNSRYNIKKKGTLHSKHKLVEFFKSRGWSWGGDWNSLKDYQHFDKP